MAFVEAPQTMEEITAVPKRVKGPCLLNVVWGGKTPEIDLRDAATMGFKLAIVPGLLLKAAIGACDAALATLKGNPYPSGPARGDDGTRPRSIASAPRNGMRFAQSSASPKPPPPPHPTPAPDKHAPAE